MGTHAWDRIPPQERLIIEQAMTPRQWAKDERIWSQGDPGESLLLIDHGVIRLEVRTDEVDIDAVLGHAEAGAMVGELSLLDGSPRSAHAIAHTDVQARVLTEAAYWQLSAQQPRAALELIRAMAQDLSGKLRHMNQRVSGQLASTAADPSVNDMVARAQAAAATLSRTPHETIFAALRDLVASIEAAAPELARLSVQETGMGRPEHRVRKIAIAGVEVLADIEREHARSYPHQTWDDGRVLVPKPAGVVFGLVPITNPVSTFVFKTLITLAAGNALILSGHRNALRTAEATGDIVRRVLLAHGLPEDSVQWVRSRASRQKTAAFMSHPDVSLILATGGPAMVQAAYSSGTPAIGVGAGNAPVLIAPDADVDQAASMVVASKSFDCGLICGSENNVVAPASRLDDVERALTAAGALILRGAARRQFETAILHGDRLHPAITGRSAVDILRHAGIDADPAPSLIVVCADDHETPESSGWLAREKLAPVVSLFTASNTEHAIDLCRRILNQCGAGHCAVIHTPDKDLAIRYAAAVPASRVLVNQPASTACAGSGNALSVSLTLGCGYWGGSSTNDNVTSRHLRNITHLAFPSPA